MLRRAAALGLLAALLLSACTVDPKPTPPPSPTPSPTYTCTAATTAQPCTAEKAHEEKEQAAAVAASTKAYTAFLAEFNRVGRAGGAANATQAMNSYAAGPYLAAYVGFVQQIKRDGERYSGQTVSREFKFVPGEHRTSAPSSEITFNFCEDGRKNIVYSATGKNLGHGVLLAGRAYVRPVDGHWKLWDSDDKAVEKCADGY